MNQHTFPSPDPVFLNFCRVRDDMVPELLWQMMKKNLESPFSRLDYSLQRGEITAAKDCFILISPIHSEDDTAWKFNMYNNRHMLSQRVPMHFGNSIILAQIRAKPCPFCICTIVTMPLWHYSDIPPSENYLKHWQCYKAVLCTENCCSGASCILALQHILLCCRRWVHNLTSHSHLSPHENQPLLCG